MEILQKQVYQTKKRPIKFLQFGEGNFLRAFIDWFIQELNDTTDFNGNVVVVQPLATGRVQELAKQDGLYTLLLEGMQNQELKSEQRIIDVLQDFINPYDDYCAYLKYAESKDLQFIISNTTEAGIAYDASDLDDHHVSPTYPGKLLTFLKHRYDFFQGDLSSGLYILPCELIDYNGNTLKNILIQLSHDRHYEEAFCTWLLQANTFYNTLVDRIVPGYPKDQISEIEKANGFIDHNIVKGEIFHLWVIEGDPKIKKDLPIDQTDLNIIVCDQVKPYKERKVKILNGSHTAIVPIAYQYGKRVVNETMQEATLTNWLYQFLEKEVWPTIDLSDDEIHSFTNAVMERFQNPTIHHELLTISLNSMTKYKTRILPSAIAIYEKNKELPRYALFSLASLFAMYRLKNQDGTCLIQDDPLFIAMWDRLWKENNISNLVDEVMSLPHWEYDFDTMEGSKAYVKECLSSIVNDGMAASLQKFFG